MLQPSNEPAIDALAPPAADPAGEAFGDYRLLGELGRGGMGVVSRAWQVPLGRDGT